MNMPLENPQHGGRWPIRTVYTDNRKISLRLEPIMWDALRDIAHHQGITLSALITHVDNAAEQPRETLASALRVYIVEFYRSQLHRK